MVAIIRRSGGVNEPYPSGRRGTISDYNSPQEKPAGVNRGCLSDGFGWPLHDSWKAAGADAVCAISTCQPDPSRSTSRQLSHMVNHPLTHGRYHLACPGGGRTATGSNQHAR